MARPSAHQDTKNDISIQQFSRCIGFDYITERGFDKVLGAMRRK
jgi:hypothetical protein